MGLKSFKYWKRQEVQDTFGLKRVFDMPLMREWVEVNPQTISENERTQIEQLRAELARFGTDWNEATLKFLFLAPFIRLINFHVGVYNPFLEHTLVAKIGNDTAKGKIDFMVARGEQIPSAPYFCLHEYKPEEGTSNDPFGQLLIAMMAAQQANEAIKLSIPVYGMYNLGAIFYFVVLNGKEYERSEPYRASVEDIFEIFLILKKARGFIEEEGKN